MLRVRSPVAFGSPQTAAAAMARQRRQATSWPSATASQQLDLASRSWLRQNRSAAGRGSPAGSSSRFSSPRSTMPVDRLGLLDLRDRGDEPARIGMPRPREELGGRRDLDHAAGIHDADPIGDLRQHAEIVRHIEHGHAEPRPQIRQQLDDLLLRRDIEAGRRFVEHDEIGLAGQRHGDADALLLAARELVRIAPPDRLRIGQSDQPEQIVNAARPLAR